MINLEENKQLFISFLKQVNRNGIDDLIAFLCDSDFFIAPASTKYHNAVEGGLCEHCLHVLDTTMKVSQVMGIDIPTESLILVCLLHDLCKINFYKKVTEQKLNTDGTFSQIESWRVKDSFPAGHGEKSVFIALKYIPLTEKEILSINYHMGSFDPRSGEYSFRDGFNNSWAPLLHTGDMLSSQYLE